MKLTLTLDLDGPHWFALAAVADKRGVKVADLVEAEVRLGLMRLTPEFRPRREPIKKGPYRRPGDGQNPYWKSRPFPESDMRREIVLREWERGRSTVEIAKLLGLKGRDRVGATIWDLGYDTGLPVWEQERRIEQEPAA